MTEALNSLCASLLNGETPKDGAVIRAFKGREIKGGHNPRQLVAWAMDKDDIRNMGAAIALLEALLPGWRYLVESKGCASVYCPNEELNCTVDKDHVSPASLALLTAAIQARLNCGDHICNCHS